MTSSRRCRLIFQVNIMGEKQWRTRICSRGRPKFFEQHSPGAAVKPSESSRNRDIEDSSLRRRGVCAVIERSLSQLHTKKFCTCAIARNAFTDTNLLVVVIGEPKNFTNAVCQNLSYLKFSLRFLGENLSMTY